MTRELRPLGAHPLLEILDDRRDLLLAHGETLYGWQAVDRLPPCEAGVDLGDGCERNRRDDDRLLAGRLRCDVGGLKAKSESEWAV